MCSDCDNDRAANLPRNMPRGRLHDPRCIYCAARYIQLLLAHPRLDRKTRSERAGRALREFLSWGHDEAEIRRLVKASGTAWAPSGSGQQQRGR